MFQKWGEFWDPYQRGTQGTPVSNWHYFQQYYHWPLNQSLLVEPEFTRLLPRYFPSLL